MNFYINKNKLLNIFLIFWIFLFCTFHMNIKNNQVFAIKVIHPNSIFKLEKIRKIIVLKLNDEIQKHESIILKNIKKLQITQKKSLLKAENLKIKKYDLLNHLVSIKIE
ncbi:hypothetical protein [Candidatus Phytoplasma bonamiae]|uniref:Sequence-variable mosaic (SVM) signal sequence domain-containing protein n=1 Tax=Candidatus Phytoplasma bonamiae TaxID=2982626 RepID=A0ABT9D4H1_9MOLU|nr:hypothetical protein ['Bonamia sp.' little leaf phytoplasma]MDO8064328.1 hypothetical protein ['Bonamia sp.' little leaf phytoplasma]MDV3174883.1 hypothetical protein ['Bonamia sp.' little leaf phytoplasma]